jgi:hypothetical protein
MLGQAGKDISVAGCLRNDNISAVDWSRYRRDSRDGWIAGVWRINRNKFPVNMRRLRWRVCCALHWLSFVSERTVYGTAILTQGRSVGWTVTSRRLEVPTRVSFILPRQENYNLRGFKDCTHISVGITLIRSIKGR